MVLVDNSVLSFSLQVNNGVPILPYFSDRADEELLHLLYYLECLVPLHDVRNHNREAFGLTKLSEMHPSEILGLEELQDFSNENVPDEQSDLHTYSDSSDDPQARRGGRNYFKD
jgi:hypothetical protein